MRNRTLTLIDQHPPVCNLDSLGAGVKEWILTLRTSPPVHPALAPADLASPPASSQGTETLTNRKKTAMTPRMPYCRG